MRGPRWRSGRSSGSSSCGHRGTGLPTPSTRRAATPRPPTTILRAALMPPRAGASGRCLGPPSRLEAGR
eukprot:3868229-Lingulodinium_polyedra.AAC.1